MVQTRQASRADEYGADLKEEEIQSEQICMSLLMTLYVPSTVLASRFFFSFLFLYFFCNRELIKHQESYQKVDIKGKKEERNVYK